MAQIHENMVKAMQAINAIGKDQVNQHYKFNFRGIDQVYNAMHPILKENGIFMLPSVLEVTREERQTNKGGTNIYTIAKIQYSFCAEDGSSVDCVVVGEAMDTSDKGMNKAMAIAHKYALFQVFCIPTEEMPDPDAEYNEVMGMIESVHKAQSIEQLTRIYQQCLQRAKAMGKEQDLVTACGTRKAQILKEQELSKPKPTQELITDSQRKAIMALYAGVDRDTRISHMCEQIERDISSFSELTKQEASTFLEAQNKG